MGWSVVRKSAALRGCILVCGIGLIACVYTRAQQPPPTPHIQRGVVMKTRDGVALRADVYSPAAEGKYPVLLQRTPYDKNGATDFAIQAVAHGYIVVVQDVRGRYSSEGDWYPFKYEMNDGYDTIEWAAGLPGSNGKVGMFGGSYVGATQMLAAVTHPPHLAAICPVVTASNYHENWTYQGGAFEQWFNESWTTGLAQDTLNRKIRNEAKPDSGEMVLPLTDYPVIQSKMQTSSVETAHELAPYLPDWAKHPEYDDYWKQWAIAERYGQIQVPALTIAAWYDIFQGGSILNYEGMRDHAGNDAARKEQRLLVTIGGHAGGGEKIGSVHFGAEAAKYDEHALTLEWYDYIFKGEKNEFASDKHVKLFVMGENKWRWEDDWPIKRTQETKFYLHSDGKANSSAGKGSLSAGAPQKESADTYTYDPAKPVPTIGGPLCCGAYRGKLGPEDQSGVEKRDDVLVYSTAPLDKDTEVTGHVKLVLYAKSSAVDTDFTGKLVDVSPDGFAKNVAEGILRARYRESTLGPAKLLKEGEVYKYEIDLLSTSNVFLKGHTIRLEVASSNFPRFDRNLNTGEDGGSSAAMLKATNSILHDNEHASELTLPIVPRE